MGVITGRRGRQTSPRQSLVLQSVTRTRYTGGAVKFLTQPVSPNRETEKEGGETQQAERARTFKTNNDYEERGRASGFQKEKQSVKKKFIPKCELLLRRKKTRGS